MKDLSARLKIAVVLLVVATMPACQLFQNAQASNHSQNGTLQTSSSTLDFGSVVIGSSKTMPVTLVNSTSATVTVTGAVVTGSGFSLSDPTLPATIAAGQSLDLNFQFMPQSAGDVTGSVTISDDASDTLMLGLSGQGVTAGQLTVNPTSIAFGNVLLGSSSTKSETFTNSGGSDLTVSQVSVSGNGFQLSGLSLPLTIAAGANSSFNVIFAPTSNGTVNGNISVTSLAASGVRQSKTNSKARAKSQSDTQTVNIPLTGTGFTQGQLTATPSSLNFGIVQVGSNQSLAEILTNTGGSTVTVSQATVAGAGYSVSGLSLPLSLAAGQSASFSVKFAPTSAGLVNGSISVVSDASNSPFSIALSGTGIAQGSLTGTPSSLAFGSIQINKTSTLSETLTNTGGSTVTISQANVTGTGFSLSGLSLPVTLTAGQTKTFSVIFAPLSAGAVNGNIAVISDASNTTLNIPLSGTGVTQGSLTATPPSLSFGNVQISKNSTLSETLTNSGGSSVTITQATVTGTGFSLSGLSLPITLTAGQSKTFTVIFAPLSAGAVTGNIAVTSDGSNPTLNIPLSGTGVTAGMLTATPPSLSFGTVQVGSNQTLSETLTNAGGTTVTVTQATVSGNGYSITGLSLPFTLTAGQSKTFSVVFAPTTGVTVNGNIAVVSDASNSPLNIPLSGTGVTAGFVSANPSSISFGNVQVGNNKSISETLTNTGGTTVTITAANVTGAGFTITGLSLPLTLISGQSFTFGAVFTPVSAGTVSGSISVVSNASNSPLAISMSGTGTVLGQLAVTPTSLIFGGVTVGSSKSLGGTLTATGATVTVSSVSVNTSEFAVTGLSFPVTITAGQSKTFTVTFTPQSSGSASDTATFVSDASNSPTVQSLSGTGVTPPQHGVDLSWDASTSPDVAGYNVYRGITTSGPYTKINAGLDASTTYRDMSVQGGQTYFYVTTAVDSDGFESENSNEVRAAIPSP